MHVKKQDEIVLMNYLATLYQKYEQQTITNLRVEEKEAKYYKNEFMIEVHRILNEMPILYTEIIKKDFLYVEDETWWKNKYDENTYKQLKNMALKAFFHCVYK